MPNSLQTHGLQHIRCPCPPLSPRVCSSSCPLSHWWHPTISSFVAPFSSCPQSFPASESFPVSRLFTLGSQILEFRFQHQSFQRIFTLISFSIDWFDLLAIQGIFKSFFQHHNLKASILWYSTFLLVQFSQAYMANGLLYYWFIVTLFIYIWIHFIHF